MRSFVLAALLTAAIVPAAASAQQSAPAAKRNSCFFLNNWDGWRVTPDGKTMYIRTRPTAFYRADFINQCRELTRAGSYPITSSPTATVCSALELNIQASNGMGFTTPCIVDKLSPMTKEEADALPKQLRP